MTKKKTGSLLIALMMLLMIVFGVSGCDYEPIPILEQGNFIYIISPNTSPNGTIQEGKKAVIYGLSEYGKTQKYLVVPETLDGYEVKDVSYNMYVYGHGDWETEVLEKVYFTKDYRMPNEWFLPNSEKRIKALFFTGYMNDIGNCDTFRPSNIEPIWEYTANTTYYWNYENSPKEGIYWIDDWDNEKIEFVPQEPVREGFVFGGWYKEAECVNKWDFDNDIVPAKLYDESKPYNKYIYAETALYAQWTSHYDH